jgi:hypothetical protein
MTEFLSDLIQLANPYTTDGFFSLFMLLAALMCVPGMIFYGISYLPANFAGEMFLTGVAVTFLALGIFFFCLAEFSPTMTFR